MGDRAMTRQRLPNRRNSMTVEFWLDGQIYKATASRFHDGRIAELFLDVGKAGSAIQEQAETAAILVSALLQNGIHCDDIRSLIRAGPIAYALAEFAGIRP
jgi:hypothetical protein